MMPPADSDQPGWLRRFRRLPEKLRLAIVALLGALIGLVTYELIYWINPFQPRASSSWLMSFAIGVPRGALRWRLPSNAPFAPPMRRSGHRMLL